MQTIALERMNGMTRIPLRTVARIASGGDGGAPRMLSIMTILSRGEIPAYYG